MVPTLWCLGARSSSLRQLLCLVGEWHEQAASVLEVLVGSHSGCHFVILVAAVEAPERELSSFCS